MVLNFFITLTPCPWLDGKHTIFGRVSAGIQVIKKIGNIQTNTDDRPIQDITIIRTRVY